MPRPKIARKSTWVDMTAFCDVAFLLLSFFIMATKTKPPEAITVMMPSSVSSKAVELNDQVMVTINREGKVFLTLSEAERKQEVVEEVAKLKGVPISAADIKKAGSVDFFGAPIAQMPSFLNLPKEQLTGDLLPGIPVVDSTNNELTLWMTAVNNIYRGGKMNLLIKGDISTKYPAFKQVLDAFKRNDFLKFNIVTNSEGIPEGSEYAKELLRKSGGVAEPADAE
jgi:biopolymer transport protein ExbD